MRVASRRISEFWNDSFASIVLAGSILVMTGPGRKSTTAQGKATRGIAVDFLGSGAILFGAIVFSMVALVIGAFYVGASFQIFRYGMMGILGMSVLMICGLSIGILANTLFPKSSHGLLFGAALWVMTVGVPVNSLLALIVDQRINDAVYFLTPLNTRTLFTAAALSLITLVGSFKVRARV